MPVKTVTKWDGDAPPTLKEAQNLVGGLVELVTLSNGDQMLVDEEGLLKEKPYNNEASDLAQRTIVGHAIILTGDLKWT